MFATLIKELKLLLRDPIGFILLLIMPGILIVVMAATQDSSYKDLQDTAFDVHIANLDKGKVGAAMVEAIGSSEKFKVITVTDTSGLLEKVNNGDIKIAAVIPDNATAALVNVSNKVANAVASQSGIPSSFSANAELDSVSIALYFDPTLKPALKNGFRFALMQYVAQAKMESLMARLTRLSGQDTKLDAALSKQMSDILTLKEYENAHFDPNKMPLNSVQHNVPSWTIFAMFLIVVPISGNMLREREEGSRTRLRLIPGAMAKATIGTILFYIFVCTLQFYLLMLIGIYLLPLFDLPKLAMGANPWNAVPLVLATAFAATSYGYFIGTAFKSPNQAMPIGAVSVVIAAIGGVWVPLEILPKAMTTIASFTPLYWSFNGINNLFVRGQGLLATLPYIGLLVGFGMILTLLCVIITKRRTAD
jgi:ABC-2 type transport system permease protein